MSKRYLIFCGLACAGVLVVLTYSLAFKSSPDQGTRTVIPMRVRIPAPEGPARNTPAIATLPFAGKKPGENGKSLLIHCKDLDAEGVAGAEIFLEPPARAPAKSLGHTGPHGSLRVQEIEAGSSLVIRHPVYMTRVVKLEQKLVHDLTIVLKRGGRIQGTVEYKNGLPLDQSVSVIAVPNGHWPDARALRRAARGDPAFHLARTDGAANGRFTITGVNPARRYTLMATGRGLAGLNRPSVKGDEDQALLKVGSLYLAVVELADASGKPLQTNTMLTSASGYISNTFGVNGAVVLDRVSPEVILANVDPWPIQHGAIYSTGPFNMEHWYQGAKKGSFGRRRFTWFLVKGGAEARLGPFSMRVRIPGYERVRTKVWADRISKHIDVQIVKLKAIQACFGALQVSFSNGFGVNVRAPQQTQPFGYLKLWHKTWKEMFNFPIWSPEKGPFMVRGVPCGSYLVFFDSAFGGYRLRPPGKDPLELRIQASGHELVSFTLPPMASLDLTNPDGTPIDAGFFAANNLETIRVSLKQVGGKHDGQKLMINFPRPPLRIVDIPVGHHAVEVTGIPYYGTGIPSVLLFGPEVLEFGDGMARKCALQGKGR